MVETERSLAQMPYFYIYQKDERLWIGMMSHMGVIAYPIDKTDWIDWLREELEICQPITVPEHIMEFINHSK